MQNNRIRDVRGRLHLGRGCGQPFGYSAEAALDSHRALGEHRSIEDAHQVREHIVVAPLQHGRGVAPEPRRFKSEPVADTPARFEHELPVARGTISEQPARALQIDEIDAIGPQNLDQSRPQRRRIGVGRGKIAQIPIRPAVRLLARARAEQQEQLDAGHVLRRSGKRIDEVTRRP